MNHPLLFFLNLSTMQNDTLNFNCSKNSLNIQISAMSLDDQSIHKVFHMSTRRASQIIGTWTSSQIDIEILWQKTHLDVIYAICGREKTVPWVHACYLSTIRFTRFYQMFKGRRFLKTEYYLQGETYWTGDNSNELF